jgi:glycosyltransferase involved in cell wall biosynthesis
MDLALEPITLIDNLSNLIGYFCADVTIFNSIKNKRGKGIVINPGIDMDLFKPKKTKKIYDVLYVGRKEKAKGYEDLLKLIKACPNHKFKIAAGNIPKKDMPKLYRQAKVLVLPSYGESYSQTVIESLACGTPVIAYDVIADELKPMCLIFDKGHWFDMRFYLEPTSPYTTPRILNKHLIKQFDKKRYLKKVEEAICSISK